MKRIMALTLGLLLITSNCFATLATYTTISSDAGVTTTALNDRYSEIKTILNGNIESVNIKDGTISSEDISVAANPLKRDGENIGEYVYSGLTIANSASTAITITAGVAYVQDDGNGYLHRVATAATNKTLPNINKDYWIYLDYAGAFTYQEVATGASGILPPNSIVIAKAAVGAVATTITDQRQTTPVNLRIYSYYKNGLVISRDTASATIITIGPGDIELGTAGKKRANTDFVSVSFSTAGIGGLDTGAIAPSTYYYIFACPSDTNAVNFKGIVSTSSTDAATVTNERLIGWCYSNAASTISTDSIGAFRKFGGDAPNLIVRQVSGDITTTSTSLVVVPGTETSFITSGRPVKFMGIVNINGVSGSNHDIALVVDSVTRNELLVSATDTSEIVTIPLPWKNNLPEGQHTASLQWKVPSGTGTMMSTRSLTIEEL